MAPLLSHRSAPHDGLDHNPSAVNLESVALTPMPKQKTHKGTKKRFRVTANGKVKHRSAGTSHLAARMSQKRKRKLRGTTTTASTNSKILRTALCGNSS